MAPKLTVHTPPPPVSDQEIVDQLLYALEMVREGRCHSVAIGLNMEDGAVGLSYMTYETTEKDVKSMMKQVRAVVSDSLDDLREDMDGFIDDGE